MTGGLNYFPLSACPAKYFSHKLAQSVLDFWKSNAPIQPIAFAETLTVVIANAKVVWRVLIRNRRCVFCSRLRSSLPGAFREMVARLVLCLTLGFGFDASLQTNLEGSREED